MKIQSKLSMAWLLSYISIATVSAAMITPALPTIERVFDLKVGEIEWIVSIFLIGYVVGQLVYGPIANVYGRLKALRWGLNINILGLLLCLLTSIYPVYLLLLFGRLVTGLGSAAGLTCTFILINEWLPEKHRKIAMAYSIFSFALGIGLAVLIGGLITQYAQWQDCFIFLLVQGLLMRFGVRVFDETLTKPKKLHIPSLFYDYKQALCSFKLITFSSIWGVCTAVGYCYSAAAPRIAHTHLGLTSSEYGYWNVLNIMSLLIGGVSSRHLLLQFRVIQVILLGYLGSGIALLSLSLLLYWHLSNVFWFFASTSLLYCFSSYLFVGGSYMASHAIEDKASASSIMSFINMAVAALSVIIMGYLLDDPFYSFLWTLTAIFLISFILLMIFKVKENEFTD